MFPHRNYSDDFPFERIGPSFIRCHHFGPIIPIGICMMIIQTTTIIIIYTGGKEKVKISFRGPSFNSNSGFNFCQQLIGIGTDKTVILISYGFFHDRPVLILIRQMKITTKQTFPEICLQLIFIYCEYL